MPASSPLNHLHDAAGATFLHYASPQSTSPDAPQANVVETFGELESEYAAIRKGCAILDAPHRATLEITGSDAIEFLNRMITQELQDFEPHQVRRSFWLNRKGRIDADLRLIRIDQDRMLVDLDLLSSAHAATSLSEYLFSEDVQITDRSDEFHRLVLHGRTAPLLLEAIAGEPVTTLEDRAAIESTIEGHAVHIARDDETADPGFHLVVESRAVEPVYAGLLDLGLEAMPDGSAPKGPYRLRPAGWHAFNIARLEAGTPLFNLDFSSSNLPAESGVLDDRVSFTKGCYLGQEVVARMKSLGHPKQTLVALRFEAPPSPGAQPLTGAPLWLDSDDDRTPIGAITSSTRSPMLGDVPIAFAQVKWAHAKPGAILMCEDPEATLRAEVQPQLRFWPRAEAAR